MASDPTSATEVAIHAGPSSETVQASGPSPLLLTPAPIETFQRDLHSLSNMAPHFSSVTMTIFSTLKKDENANRLRKILLPFIRSMYLASRNIEESLHLARAFYSNDVEDYAGLNIGQHTTPEDVAKLFDPKEQTRIMTRAAEVIRESTTAYTHLQKAIRRAPAVARELTTFIYDYQDREFNMQKREQSLVLALYYSARDIVWKKVDPVTLKSEEVENLSSSFAEGSAILEKSLLAFVDSWRAHFQRLYEVAQSNEQMVALGYRSTEDFRRLYQDRLICIRYIDTMQRDWDELPKAFAFGSDAVIPHAS